MMPPPFISYGPLIREAPGPSSVRQGLWHPTITSAGPNHGQSTYLLPYDYESKHVQDLTYCNNVHLSLSRWQMNDRRMSYPAAIPPRVCWISRSSLRCSRSRGCWSLRYLVLVWSILHPLFPITRPKELTILGRGSLTFSTYCYRSILRLLELGIFGVGGRKHSPPTVTNHKADGDTPPQ